MAPDDRNAQQNLVPAGFRVPEEEKELVEALADVRGITFSDLCRGVHWKKLVEEARGAKRRLGSLDDD